MLLAEKFYYLMDAPVHAPATEGLMSAPRPAASVEESFFSRQRRKEMLQTVHLKRHLSAIARLL